MKAALYIRVSTDMQKEKGDSLADQETRLRNYAKAKSWKITEIYKDAGIPAIDTSRPAFQEMYKDIEALIALLPQAARMFLLGTRRVSYLVPLAVEEHKAAAGEGP